MWGKQLGLTLSQVVPSSLPQGVLDFLAAMTTTDTTVIYTDGSFDLVHVPLLDALTAPRTVQTTRYGRGATGIYSPPQDRPPALALQPTTPQGVKGTNLSFFVTLL